MFSTFFVENHRRKIGFTAIAFIAMCNYKNNFEWLSLWVKQCNNSG
jgi:hypothetical protein